MLELIARVAASVAKAAPGLVGLALVAYGAWLAYPPAGFVVGGLLVLADVVAGSTPASDVSPTVEDL